MFPMTPVILKNLITPKATRLYPFEARAPYGNARGAIVNDQDVCTFCGICAAKCPSACLSVDRKTATWKYEPAACVFCGVCVASCPKGSLVQKTAYPPVSHAKETVVLTGVVREKAAAAPGAAGRDTEVIS